MGEYFYRIIYDLIIKPSDGMDEVSRRKPWVLVFMLFAGAHISRVVGGSLSLSVSGGFGRAVIVFGLGFGIAVWLLAWIAVTGIFHLSAELWKTEGNARELFMMLGVCLTPALFITPLSLVARGLGGAALFFFILFMLGIHVWVAALSIMAIKKVYNCSMEKALRIFFTPLFFMFIVLLVLPVVVLLVIVVAL